MNITLRDQFAIAALPIIRVGISAEIIAQVAYQVADAMMEARAVALANESPFEDEK